jgi:hypothetical protein
MGVGEPFIWTGLLLVYAVATLGYILVGLPVIILSGVIMAILYVATYLRVLTHVMVVSSSPIAALTKYDPSRSSAEGRQPAYRQYYYDQAMHDLRHIVSVSLEDGRRLTSNAIRWSGENRFYTGEPFLAWPVAIVVRGGLAIGIIGGSSLVAAIAAYHAALVLILRIVAGITAQLLRVSGWALLRVTRAQVMCGRCCTPVADPVYECPGEDCSLRHSEVRPGGYGVFHRTCRCGARMPTVAYFGTKRLNAFCPRCAEPLSKYRGRVN